MSLWWLCCLFGVCCVFVRLLESVKVRSESEGLQCSEGSKSHVFEAITQLVLVMVTRESLNEAHCGCMYIIVRFVSHDVVVS